jgi:rhamnulokinase
VATASHDTASAIASVPASESPFAYLSSGTWGLLGSEIANPILSDDVYRFGFVNQGGVEDRIRLLHNSLNMWLLQECRRIWSLEGTEYSWEDLIGMASPAEAFTAFIDTDDPALLLPLDMPLEIQRLCHDSNQVVPHSKGEILRVILESLAFKNRYLFDELTIILTLRPKTLHVVGGGARNRLLNQFLADAIDVPVVAGPCEATAVGNILVQMIANGELRDLDEGRELVRNSFFQERFEPTCPRIWEENYARFKRVTGLD